MYYEVASKMVVVSGTAYTQAVSMEGANAVMVEMTNFGGAAGTATIQEGNDLENWSTTGTGAIPASGYGTVKGTAIASRYVRLMIVAGATPVILGAGINTKSL